MDRYYVYNDWSHVPSNQNDMRSIEKDESMHPAAQRLPTKLNKMLEDPDLSGIVEWRPHGRSWRVVNRDNFISKALPLYFQHSNFTSFVRLVNAWGFRRVTSGDDNDSYYHELFLRGMRHLHIRMRRLMLDERKAPIQQYDRCPDFYSMPAVETVPPGSNSTAPSYSDKAIAALSHFSVQQRPSLSTDISGAKISSPSLATPYDHIDFPSNRAANQNSHNQETCSQTMNHNLSLQNPSSLTMQQLSSNLLPMIPEMSQVNTRQCILNTSSLGMAHGEVLLEARRSQSDALPRQDSFVTQNMTATKTAGSFQLQTSATSNRIDPLVATLANILLPRARRSGLPRNNGELVDMLIREWHDSPSCGRENEHEILLQTLAGRSRRLQQYPITSNGHRNNAAFGSSTSLLGSQSSTRSFSVDANEVAKGKKTTWLGLIGHLSIQNQTTSRSRGAGESIDNHDSAEQKPHRSKKSLRCGNSKSAGRKEFSPTEGRQRP